MDEWINATQLKNLTESQQPQPQHSSDPTSSAHWECPPETGIKLNMMEVLCIKMETSMWVDHSDWKQKVWRFYMLFKVHGPRGYRSVVIEGDCKQLLVILQKQS